MDRLFLDANVLFTAAHRAEGKAAYLFLNAKRWRLLACEYAVEEARRNLQLKFPRVQADFEKLLSAIEWTAQPASARPILDLPAKDRPIWAAAVGGRATHLLTGDLRDFGRFMNCPERTGGIMIQTVAQYLDSLE